MPINIVFFSEKSKKKVKKCYFLLIFSEKSLYFRHESVKNNKTAEFLFSSFNGR